MTPPSRIALGGPVLFARYAYPPNALGYCGVHDPATLLGLAADFGAHGTADQDPGGTAEAAPESAGDEGASNAADDADLRHLASSFDGAWPYLELIAAGNAIEDPLDREVVEAYSVGNSSSTGSRPMLCRNLSPTGSLAPPAACCKPRRHRLRRAACHTTASTSSPCTPGSSCCVQGQPALTVLDRCRVRWGTVTSVEGDLAAVNNRLLKFNGSELYLGEEEVEFARWSTDGIDFGEGPGSRRSCIASLGLGLRSP